MLKLWIATIRHRRTGRQLQRDLLAYGEVDARHQVARDLEIAPDWELLSVKEA